MHLSTSYVQNLSFCAWHICYALDRHSCY